MEMHLNMSAQYRQFCLDLNVLTKSILEEIADAITHHVWQSKSQEQNFYLRVSIFQVHGGKAKINLDEMMNFRNVSFLMREETGTIYND